MSEIGGPHLRTGSILLLILLMMVTGAAFNTLTFWWWDYTGHSPEYLMSSSDLSSDERRTFRIGLMINHVGMFLIPGLAFSALFLRRRTASFLMLNRPLPAQTTFFWLLVIVFSYPIVGYLTQLNEYLPLPEWAKSAQNEAFGVLGNVLRMDNFSEFLTALFLVGVLPALGEELIFRGLIQQRLIDSLSNDHLAIFIASLVFGLFHFQLERFIPLTFLGVLLGYAYYYTKSFWTPVILHLFINGSQVTALYYSSEFSIEEIQNSPDLPLPLVMGSVILTSFFFYIARRSQSEDRGMI